MTSLYIILCLLRRAGLCVKNCLCFSPMRMSVISAICFVPPEIIWVIESQINFGLPAAYLFGQKISMADPAHMLCAVPGNSDAMAPREERL